MKHKTEKQIINDEVRAIYGRWKKLMSRDEMCAVLGTVMGSAQIISRSLVSDLENGFEVNEDEKYALLLILTNIRSLCFKNEIPPSFEVQDMAHAYDDVEDRLKILVKMLHKQLFEDKKGE